MTLKHWPHPNRRPGRVLPERIPKAIVLVHGIFSDHHTFSTLHQRLATDARFNGFEFFYFDYDYNEKLETNGTALRNALNERFQPGDQVAIVAHSMGGLISRLALLSTRLPFLKILFLVATPNSGAIRLRQLALLTQMMHFGVGTLFALFPRKAGIVELSQAAKIMERNLSGAIHANDVDYVSIPGLYFHEERGPLEFGRHLAAKGFSTLDVLCRISLAMVPLASVTINRPHDGIVEEDSNNLIKCPSGTWHEKVNSIQDRRSTLATYAHVRLKECSTLTHVDVHHEPSVIETIARITLVTFNLRSAHEAALRRRQNKGEVQAEPARTRLEHWNDELSEYDKSRVQVFFDP